MAETIKINPYSFGGDLNPAVDVDPEVIRVIYQTVRDAHLNDQLYTPKLLARVVRAGLEIMTDANMQDLIKD